jgi:hypothetical protein
MDKSGRALGAVAECCNRGNETSRLMKFLEYL